MYTYQDYEQAIAENRKIDFIAKAINEYKSTVDYKIALDADEYEAERNITILTFMRYVYGEAGQKLIDFTAVNNKLASNFFHRLTTQRVEYSLGNGISFASENSKSIKDKLGKKFDNILKRAGKYALIHKVSYIFWNYDHANCFKMTEFLPLFDEDTGVLRAGFRFWSLDWDKRPVSVVVYEEDGYEKYKTKKGSKGLDLELVENKKGYKQEVAHNDIDPDEVVGESNYSVLPIFPLYGNENKQSDLVGMRAKIDSYDLIKSGFANDVEECAEIYWLIGNAMGMNDQDLTKFRDRIKLNHIAVADTTNSTVTPYTQDIPYAARESLLKSVREQIYEDYGGLDVHTIAAGATNDHIDAAYQPMDEEADDFEYQVIECVQGVLSILGIEDVPVFKRNRISNHKEQTETIMLVADKLDDETLLKKLPFITDDEVEGILSKKDKEDQDFVAVEEEDTEE